MEILFVTIVLPAMVVGFFALLFGLSRVISWEWIRRVGSGLRAWKFNLWQMMAVVIVAALVFCLLTGPGEEERVFSALLLSFLVLAWFVRAWCHEFAFVMGLRDDDFPGRNDKLIWAIVLVMFAPISVWFFRSFRLAYWPDPEPVAPSPTGLYSERKGATAAQPT
jgi:hypothetical protein